MLSPATSSDTLTTGSAKGYISQRLVCFPTKGPNPLLHLAAVMCKEKKLYYLHPARAPGLGAPGLQREVGPGSRNGNLGLDDGVAGRKNTIQGLILGEAGGAAVAAGAI